MTGTVGGGVPVARWGPETVERRHLFEAWHEVVRPLVDTAPLGSERAFSGGGEVAKVGDLVLTRVYFDPQRFDRSRRQMEATRCLSLQYYRRGRFTGIRAGAPHLLAPDRIGLIDYSHAYCGVADEPSEVLGVALPWDQVDALPLARQGVWTWRTDSPQGRLLLGALEALRASVPGLTAAAGREASAGFTGLVNGLLGARRETCEDALVQRATLAAIERYIDRHLGQPGLDAATLCRAFACSRSRLYRLFEAHGGVDRYIRERRLARSFRELAVAGPATRVWQVAARWGFDSPSHFNRLFKQQFGVRPSDLLGAGPSDAAPVPLRTNPAVERIHRWLYRL